MHINLMLHIDIHISQNMFSYLFCDNIEICIWTQPYGIWACEHFSCYQSNLRMFDLKRNWSLRAWTRTAIAKIPSNSHFTRVAKSDCSHRWQRLVTYECLTEFEFSMWKIHVLTSCPFPWTNPRPFDTSHAIVTWTDWKVKREINWQVEFW